jgi:hypothetical protein
LGLVVLLFSTLAYASTTSTLPNPTVVFSAPGPQPVTLEVCNYTACDTITRMVTVLDPRPAVTLASVLTPAVEVGQLAFLTGSGTGKPPLAYTWQIFLGSVPLLSLPGSTPYWDTSGFPPGAYTAVLRIENASGFAESLPRLVTVEAARPGDFYTISPCRVYDSRSSAAIGSGSVRTIGVGGSCDIPLGARAVAANVTVVSSTSAGYAALYPGNYPLPATSTINFVPSATRANNAVLSLATDGTGTLAIFVSTGDGGGAHMIVDVSGYFLPEAP